jgi:hypothetical protein
LGGKKLAGPTTWRGSGIGIDLDSFEARSGTGGKTGHDSGTDIIPPGIVVEASSINFFFLLLCELYKILLFFFFFFFLV